MRDFSKELRNLDPAVEASSPHMTTGPGPDKTAPRPDFEGRRRRPCERMNRIKGTSLSQGGRQCSPLRGHACPSQGTQFDSMLTVSSYTRHFCEPVTARVGSPIRTLKLLLCVYVACVRLTVPHRSHTPLNCMIASWSPSASRKPRPVKRPVTGRERER